MYRHNNGDQSSVYEWCWSCMAKSRHPTSELVSIASCGRKRGPVQGKSENKPSLMFGSCTSSSSAFWELPQPIGSKSKTHSDGLAASLHALSEKPRNLAVCVRLLGLYMQVNASKIEEPIRPSASLDLIIELLQNDPLQLAMQSRRSKRANGHVRRLCFFLFTVQVISIRWQHI